MQLFKCIPFRNLKPFLFALRRFLHLKYAMKYIICLLIKIILKLMYRKIVCPISLITFSQIVQKYFRFKIETFFFKHEKFHLWVSFHKANCYRYEILQGKSTIERLISGRQLTGLFN